MVEGRIQKLNDRVRVTVQLVHVATGSPAWAASFDDQFEDLLRLEDSISEQVARALVPQLTGEEREQLARAGTSSPRPTRRICAAAGTGTKAPTESLAQALVAFMQAIAEDPNYAGAHAGVADYYVLLGMRGGLPPSESFAAAKEAAETALRIDPALAEAHASLGFALWAHDRDYATAAHEFQLAIALNPDYAPAHHWLGLLNSARGRPEMAMACLERARKLDPNRADLRGGPGAVPLQCAAIQARYRYLSSRRSRPWATIPSCTPMLALSYRFDGQLDKALEAARAPVAWRAVTYSRSCVLAEVEAAPRRSTLGARTLLKQSRQRAESGLRVGLRAGAAAPGLRGTREGSGRTRTVVARPRLVGDVAGRGARVGMICASTRASGDCCCPASEDPERRPSAGAGAEDRVRNGQAVAVGGSSGRGRGVRRTDWLCLSGRTAAARPVPEDRR